MPSNLPKISIIIGVRNMRDSLDKAIQSLLEQQYPHLELIIMDGGSTDGSLDIIKKYVSHISHWESKPDKGHPDACNKAIDIATGELIGFLNADDYFEPGLLQKIAEKFQANPNAGLITCGIKIVEQDATGEIRLLQEISQANKLQLTLHNMLFEHTLFNARFFNKNIFKRFGKFPAFDAQGHVNRSNDREYLLQLALNHVQSEMIAEPLYVYLSHQGASSFSKKNRERIHTEHLLLARKLLANENISVSEKNLIKTWAARESVYLFLTFLQQKDFVKALNTIVTGALKMPLRWMKEFGWYAKSKYITSIFKSKLSS